MDDTPFAQHALVERGAIEIAAFGLEEARLAVVAPLYNMLGDAGKMEAGKPGMCISWSANLSLWHVLSGITGKRADCCANFPTGNRA